MKVLLLEDELMLQSAMVEYLSDCGYDIDATEDGDETLQKARVNRYDLFIFDINIVITI